MVRSSCRKGDLAGQHRAAVTGLDLRAAHFTERIKNL